MFLTVWRLENLTSKCWRWDRKPRSWGWKDVSVVKGTGCSSKGPGFSTQQVQWQLTTVCDSNSRGCDNLRHKDRHAGKIPKHVKKINKQKLTKQNKKPWSPSLEKMLTGPLMPSSNLTISKYQHTEERVPVSTVWLTHSGDMHLWGRALSTLSLEWVKSCGRKWPRSRKNETKDPRGHEADILRRRAVLLSSEARWNETGRH